MCGTTVGINYKPDQEEKVEAFCRHLEVAS